MKRVFNTSSEVAHLWVHEAQTEARVSNNKKLFFDDTEYLWSYGRHYCVARRLPGNFVAVNFRENSVTTNAVNSDVRQACRNVLTMLEIEDPDKYTPYIRSNTFNRVQRLLDEAARARPNGNRPALLAQAQKVAADFNKFAELLGEKYRVEVPTLTDEEVARVRAARREELAREKQQKAEREARIKQEHAALLERWLAGVGNYLPFGVEMLLRIKDGNVETSHHAKVPVEDAKKLWPLIQRARRSGGFEMDLQVGHYPLKRVSSKGDVVIGCHHIPYAQLERMAVQLGLVQEEVA
jgi:hypothetical protein